MTIEEQHTLRAIQSIDRTLRTVDWEQRRYEIAKDIFTRLLTHVDGDVRSFSCKNIQMTAADCVREATALIEELKNKPHS